MQDSDPQALFGYVAEQLNERKLAFIFVREALDTPQRILPLIRKTFSGVVIANDGLTREAAEQLLTDGEADAVSFGRVYISNPDLVERLRRGAPLNELNSNTIYSPGAEGYTDYPALAE